MTSTPDAPAPKSFLTAWLLALLLGGVGADRFYLGKPVTAILKLLTVGGLGIWALVDLIVVLLGAARDKRGRPLEGYARAKVPAIAVTAGVLALSVVIGAISGAASTRSVDRIAVAEAPAAAVETPAVAVPNSEAPTPASEAPTAGSWADKKYGTFVSISESGSGDSIVSLPAGATAGIVTAQYTGESNFALQVIDAQNASTGQLLVNTIGGYTGTTAYGFNALAAGAAVQITASGPWTLRFDPVSAAPPLAAAGSGDAVFLYSEGAARLTASHSGESNFVVQEETDGFAFGLLVNEIGAYTGTVPLSAGPSVITVTADGAWTLVRS